MNTLQLVEEHPHPSESVSFPAEYLLVHMPKAHPLFNMVYMYGYTLYFLRKSSSNQFIAQKLNMLESDVIKAWEYWEKTGLIRIIDRKNFREFTIDFLISSTTPISDSKEDIQQEPHIKKLTTDQYDPVVKRIMKIAQKELGLLSPIKAESILSFYFDYRLPVEVIEELFRYCKEKRKLNINYMEAIAKEWSKAGVNSLQQAQLLEREAGEESNLYFQIQKIIGIQYDGQIKDIEKEKYARWTKQYGYTLEIVEKAAEIAIERGVKGNLNYIDGIIKKWYKDGVRIMEDISAAEMKYREGNKSPSPKDEPKIKAYTKSSILKNYEEVDVDYDKAMEVHNKLTAEDIFR